MWTNSFYIILQGNSAPVFDILTKFKIGEKVHFELGLPAQNKAERYGLRRYGLSLTSTFEGRNG